MKLADIWYTDTNKETGENFGAKAKILPGDDKDKCFDELKDFVKKKLYPK